jgi:hypothetical protein
MCILSPPSAGQGGKVTMLAVGANSTAIMAALPSMRTDLVLNPEGVQWAKNAGRCPKKFKPVSAFIEAVGMSAFAPPSGGERTCSEGPSSA